jgi:hypothetical protein
LKEKWIFAAPEGSINRAPKPLHREWIDSGLSYLKNRELPESGALWPAELVVRDATKGTILESLPFDLPFD